ncbi:beta-D-glucosyl crocetin beta-1,6-glucosyltransferase-like protein [Tanacetum coccineum]
MFTPKLPEPGMLRIIYYLVEKRIQKRTPPFDTTLFIKKDRMISCCTRKSTTRWSLLAEDLFMAVQGSIQLCYFYNRGASNVAAMANMLWIIAEMLYYRAYEYWNVKEVLESEANGRKDKDRVIEGVENSSSIDLAKSFKEIEGKYADYFTELTGKRVVPVGPLVVDVVHVDNEQNNVIHWLDTKTTGSTVFVCFGSEYFLSEPDLNEIAYGLESSNANFIWVLRFPRGHLEGNLTVEQALPQGFFERVQNRGLVVEGWAPQAKILAHKNIGGFVSHCGWSSVMEAMKFGVPIIAMPMHLDQAVNARWVVELGLGKEVLRDGNGVLSGHKVAEVVEQVVLGKLGENVRAKAKKMSHDLKIKGDEEIDIVADELLQLCNSAQPRRVVGGGLYKTRSEAFVLEKSWAVKGQRVIPSSRSSRSSEHRRSRRHSPEYDRREGWAVSRRGDTDDKDYRDCSEPSPRQGRDNRYYDIKRSRYESSRRTPVGLDIYVLGGEGAGLSQRKSSVSVDRFQKQSVQQLPLVQMAISTHFTYKW